MNDWPMRILRLYVTQENPSEDLITLVEFIVKVYAPFWFRVKQHPEAIHGSRNVFRYIVWVRQLPLDVQLTIRPAIEGNAFFFHPENILLSMITDTDDEIRRTGYQRILQIRENHPLTLRSFYMPRNTIEFCSESYDKMIDWTGIRVTEPPCLQFIDQKTLVHFRDSSDIIQIPGITRKSRFHT